MVQCLALINLIKTASKIAQIQISFQIVVAGFHGLSGICLGSRRSATCCLRTQILRPMQRGFFPFSQSLIYYNWLPKTCTLTLFRFLKKRFVSCSFKYTNRGRNLHVTAMRFLLKNVQSKLLKRIGRFSVILCG